MSQQPPVSDEPMVGEVRFRVPLPIVIPVVALAIIATLAIGFSKVLLSVPHEAATVIGMATAANLLAVCAYVAFRKRVTGSTGIELAAILIYPVLIGIVIANLNFGDGHGDAAAAAEESGNGGLVVTAMNIAFDTAEIVVPAGEEVSLRFDNPDSVEHNISVYPDAESGLAGSDALFEGDIIQGGEEITYEMGPFEAGEYYFQCDVHPNMSGDFIAE